MGKTAVAKSEQRANVVRKSLEKAVVNGDLKSEMKNRKELGENLRSRGLGMEAIEQYTQALAKSDNNEQRLRFLNALTELHAEEGNEVEMANYIKQYEDEVTSIDEVHLCQFTSAWSILHLHKTKSQGSIKDAKKRALRSMQILKNNRPHMKCNLEKGETIEMREGDVAKLLAEICGFLGEKKEAEEYLEIAKSLLTSPDKQFELMGIEYGFEWSNKMEIALKIASLAKSAINKFEAQLKIARAYFELGSMEEGIDILQEEFRRVQTIQSHFWRKTWQQMAVFAYKVRAVKNELNMCEREGNREGQLKCKDQLGDLFSEADYDELAMAHYGNALKISLTLSEKKSTLTSLATVSWEMNKWKETEGYYLQLKDLEEEAGVDTVETEVELFKTRLGSGMFKSELEIVEEVKKFIPKTEFMTPIYESLLEHYEELGQEVLIKKYKNLCDLTRRKFDTSIRVEEEEEKIQEPKKVHITFGGMDDTQILRKFEEECRMYQKAKTAGKGKFTQSKESKIIVCARHGKMKQLAELIEQGVDVNESNAVGVTALSEAVASSREDIVKFLLEKGANPNSEATDGWEKSNMDAAFGGGITPLHEACWIGNVPIAKRLISADADVTAANEDGWRAFDFLKLYIERNSFRLDEKSLNECISFNESLREMEANAGFFRPGNPAYPKRTENRILPLVEKKERKRRYGEGEKEEQGGLKELSKRARGQKITVSDENREMDENEEDKREGDEEIEKEKLDRMYEALMHPESLVLGNETPRYYESSMIGHNYGDNRQWNTTGDGPSSPYYDNEPISNWGVLVRSEDERESERIMLKKEREMAEMAVNRDKNNEMLGQNSVPCIPFSPVKPSMSPTLMKLEIPDYDERDIKTEFVWEKNEEAPVSNGMVNDSNQIDTPSTSSNVQNSSAGNDVTLVRVSIFDGTMQRKRVLIEATGFTRVCDLPFHYDLQRHLENEKCEWFYEGDEIESVSIASLCALANRRPIELMCIVNN